MSTDPVVNNSRAYPTIAQSMIPRDSAKRIMKARKEAWIRDHRSEIDYVIDKTVRALNSCSCPEHELYIDFAKLDEHLSDYLYRTS